MSPQINNVSFIRGKLCSRKHLCIYAAIQLYKAGCRYVLHSYMYIQPFVILRTNNSAKYVHKANNDIKLA